MRSWWHAGEEYAVAVYSQRVFLIAAIAIALFVCFWLVGSIFHRTEFLPFAAAAFALRIIVERRRAIIFTLDEFIYRPLFGSPVKFTFNGKSPTEDRQW